MNYDQKQHMKGKCRVLRKITIVYKTNTFHCIWMQLLALLISLMLLHEPLVEAVTAKQKCHGNAMKTQSPDSA